MRRGRRLVGAIGLALLLASCGDDGPAPAEILADDLLVSDAFAEIDLTDVEATCAAEAAVAALGDARVEELGLDEAERAPTDFASLDPDDLDSIIAAIRECDGDLGDVLAATISDGIVDEPDEALPVSRTEAKCVADRLVSGFGEQRLLTLGAATGGGDPFSNGAIDEEETGIVADSFLECLDIRQVFRDQFVADGVPEATAECLAGELPDEQLRDLFVAQFAGEATDADQLVGPALATCGLD